ncbi:MAG: hypothetical protein J7494_06435 [Sphingobium sp.]|nr:hypothetical protein [Sphingobium sp.]
MKQYLKLAAAAALIVAGTAATPVYAQAAKKPAAPAAKPAAAKPAAARPAAAAGARLGGHPNLNGIWQVISEANFNLEPHDSATSKAGERQLGAIAATHGGLGVVVGGVIPYKPEAQKERDGYRASAPKYDPEAACYLPGIPRATYMDHPFQIIQGEKGDMLMVYEYANANRAIKMGPVGVPSIDTWMGTSYGEWKGDTLQIVTLSQSPGEYKAPAGEMMQNKTWLDRSGNFVGPNSSVTETFRLIDKDHIAYEATITDPELYTKPWKIQMTLYRRLEPNAELMDFRCVPYSEEFLYGDLHETAPAGK